MRKLIFLTFISILLTSSSLLFVACDRNPYRVPTFIYDDGQRRSANILVAELTFEASESFLDGNLHVDRFSAAGIKEIDHYHISSVSGRVSLRLRTYKIGREYVVNARDMLNQLDIVYEARLLHVARPGG